jgi:ketosteroid isomerase-like protein
MSEENVEIVLAALDAWNHRDFDAATGLVQEDVELHLIGGFADVIGREFKGRDAVIRFWRDFVEAVGGELELETVHDAGDRVVTIATIRGAGEASGIPVENRFGQVWSLRDAKVSRMDSYYEVSEALEAAGLQE